jgi:hypothetical protein
VFAWAAELDQFPHLQLVDETTTFQVPSQPENNQQDGRTAQTILVNLLYSFYITLTVKIVKQKRKSAPTLATSSVLSHRSWPSKLELAIKI